MAESVTPISTTIKLGIRDSHGYISTHDYKANREELYRARLWKNQANVDRYLNTDSYRRLAKHTTSDLVIEEVEEIEESVVYEGFGRPLLRYRRRVIRAIRTIPQAEVAAAAARASTRAERLARGLRR